MDEFLDALRQSIERDTFAQLVLSKPLTRASNEPTRVKVRPVRNRSGVRYQWTSRVGTQELHENLDPKQFCQRVADHLGRLFRDAHLFTTDANLALRVSGGGKIRLRRSAPTAQTPATDHNREKSYLIPEGTPCAFLEAIGVMTPDGRVRAKSYGKFRQINRFLELVNDVYDELPASGTLEVVDFGCGKSYLTFALRHLFAGVHRRSVRIVALDREAAVIGKCSRIAADLGYRDIDFRHGNIAGYQTDGPVHLTVALHACDTATDDALAQAVAWQSHVILAAPCCQHELNNGVNSEALELLTRHGILKERLAALATDALRASALEQAGYRTQVIEFVDLEHTAKNLLIRAIRRTPGECDFSEAARASRLKKLLGIDRLQVDQIVAPETRIPSLDDGHAAG